MTLPGRDEVLITFSLHELDFVTLVRAARLTGASRETMIRQAIASYLVQLQNQGLDLGIQLPAEAPPKEVKSAEEAKADEQAAP